MENLFIPGSKGVYFVPEVNFNYETGICELSGESYLEDTAKFYAPVIAWICEFTISSNKKIIFNIKLTYFNTSTSRAIMEIMNLLAEYYEYDNEMVDVFWYYDPMQDTDIKEDVEDYLSEMGVKIQMVAI